MAPHPDRPSAFDRGGHPRPWRLPAALALLTPGAALAPLAFGDPSDGLVSPTNVATAQATSWMPSSDRLAWWVGDTFAPAVAPDNSAYASARQCTGCQAAAVAVQVVLASRASTIEPTNTALAIETACTTCDVAAEADQWIVVSTTGWVSLSPAGTRALDQVRRTLGELLEAASPTAIDAAMPQVDATVNAILAEDVLVREPPPGDPSTSTTTTTPGAVTTTTPPRPPLGRLPGPHHHQGRGRARDRSATAPAARARARVEPSAVGRATVIPESGYVVYWYDQSNESGPTSPTAATAAGTATGASG